MLLRTLFEDAGLTTPAEDMREIARELADEAATHESNARRCHGAARRSAARAAAAKREAARLARARAAEARIRARWS